VCWASVARAAAGGTAQAARVSLFDYFVALQHHGLRRLSPRLHDAIHGSASSGRGRVPNAKSSLGPTEQKLGHRALRTTSEPTLLDSLAHRGPGACGGFS
jgi:hypothetical protein